MKSTSKKNLALLSFFRYDCLNVLVDTVGADLVCEAAVKTAAGHLTQL
jgi:hypothetical protein